MNKDKTICPLTGNWYLRKGWFGFTVMVEVYDTDYHFFYDTFDEQRKHFRKATAEDLHNLNITVV